MKNLAFIFTFALFFQTLSFAQAQTQPFAVSVSKKVSGGFGRACAAHRESEFLTLENELQVKAEEKCKGAKRVTAISYASSCTDESASVFRPDNLRLYKVEAEFTCPRRSPSGCPLSWHC